MSGYKLPMEVEATIQHQAAEIMQLKQKLAECERERDEYNTARLGLIADIDKMWDERHEAQQESNAFRNERDAIWHSYKDCIQQLATVTKERDEATEVANYWRAVRFSAFAKLCADKGELK